MCVTAWTNFLLYFILGSHHCKQLQARKTRDRTSMLAFRLSCINTSLQCGANSTSHNRKHPTTRAPILFWFAFPSFFTNFEFFMCPFFTIPFHVTYFPVLYLLQKLPKTTSQYCFVLHSLHKTCPSTTLYYKLAQNTSKYYFVLPSLHKAFPSTTLYYKACRN